MTDQQTKDAANTIISKAGNWLKDKINSTKIPSLLSFFVAKDGTINPTLEQTLAGAPDAQNNWTRLGLDKQIMGLPVWCYLALPIVVIAVKWGSEALQFFIEIFSKGILLVPFALILYLIWKSFKK